MSRVATPQNIETLGLSSDAQALLADIVAETAPPKLDVAAESPAMPEADESPEAEINTPVSSTMPVADPSVEAFTDLLNQLAATDSEALTASTLPLLDEGAPLAQGAPKLETQEPETQEPQAKELATQADPALEEWATQDIIAAVGGAGAGATDVAADLSAADLDAIDAALAEEGGEANAKGGLLARFRRGGGDVGVLVGVKDANSAYETQASGSRLPATIIRVLVLILVAAVPPFVNLVFIQPQISDNNVKLSEMQQFEAQAVADKKAALDLDKKIVRAQKISARLAGDLPPSEDFETLFASYMAALERYGVTVNSYNISANEDRGAPIANSKMIANLVEIDLVGRYDVYAEIRRVFAEESRQIIVVEETMSARPDSLELDISAKMIVPTKGKDSGNSGGKDSE